MDWLGNLVSDVLSIPEQIVDKVIETPSTIKEKLEDIVEEFESLFD